MRADVQSAKSASSLLLHLNCVGAIKHKGKLYYLYYLLLTSNSNNTSAVRHNRNMKTLLLALGAF